MTTTTTKQDEPVMGIPYAAAHYHQAPMQPPYNQQYYVGQNPYQAGAIPPNVIVGDPKGIPLQQTIYRDTPAPINCVFCGSSGVSTVRWRRRSQAAAGNRSCCQCCWCCCFGGGGGG